LRGSLCDVARTVDGGLQRTAKENSIPVKKCRPLCSIRPGSRCTDTVAIRMDNRQIAVASKLVEVWRTLEIRKLRS
jgi:hypothetical protein